MKKSLMFSLVILMTAQAVSASFETVKEFLFNNKAALIGMTVGFGGLKLARKLTDTREYNESGEVIKGGRSPIDEKFFEKFNSKNGWVGNNKTMFGFGAVTMFLLAAKAQNQWNPLKLFFKV